MFHAKEQLQLLNGPFAQLFLSADGIPDRFRPNVVLGTHFSHARAIAKKCREEVQRVRRSTESLKILKNWSTLGADFFISSSCL